MPVLRTIVWTPLSTLLLLLAGTAVGQDETEQPPAKSVKQLVRDLNSDSYETRARATRQLASAGAEAVELLTKEAQGERLESAVRAIKVLEKMYTSGREQDVAAAEVALELITAADNPSAAMRAEFVLTVHNDVRQVRALVKIVELGGQIQSVDDSATINLHDADILDDAKNFLLLGEQWKGGDEGLKYIKRLKKLRVMYVSGDPNISENAMLDLQQALPDLQIAERGKAKLGVTGTQGAIGRCLISSVKEGSAAHKGGIAPGDSIMFFDKQRVTSFEALVEMIGKKNPGDTVEIVVERNNRPLKLTVTLDGWTSQPVKK